MALENKERAYRIESAGGELPLAEGELAIVLPRIPLHLYAKIRPLFFGEAAIFRFTPLPTPNGAGLSASLSRSGGAQKLRCFAVCPG
ncbi:MAG: hypothetical protein H0Z34_00540 [Brevibacillus sp.]|nr:hypothetical protein [Brevibacillus sp.]